MSIYEFTSQIFFHSGRWSDYESTFSIKKTLRSSKRFNFSKGNSVSQKNNCCFDSVVEHLREYFL